VGPLADQKVCLDTTVLIDVLRDERDAVGKVRELREQGWDLHTTSVNAFELYTGAYLTNPVRRIPQVEGILGEMMILTLTSKEAKEAGTLFAELQRRGEKVEIRDVLIAGTILNNACHNILTRNVEFRRFRSIHVLSY